MTGAELNVSSPCLLIALSWRTLQGEGFIALLLLFSEVCLSFFLKICFNEEAEIAYTLIYPKKKGFLLHLCFNVYIILLRNIEIGKEQFAGYLLFDYE